MKILDIIVPHEILNENRVTNWFARTFARSAGETAEAKVSSWVDNAIRQIEASNPGHAITRTKELKQAESALVAVVERNPYPDELAKIDSLATSLSEYLISTGRSRVEGSNALETLAELVRKGSIKPPSVYGSKEEFLSDPFIVTELRGLATAAGTRIELAGSKYIRELAEVRTQVYKEIQNIQPVKTRAQKKQEKEEAKTLKKQQDTAEIKTDNDLQAAKNTSSKLTLEAKALEEKLAKNELELAGYMKKQTRVIQFFAGSEAARVFAQFSQQMNNSYQWRNGWQDGTSIPAEIAKNFPDVPDGGIKDPNAPSIKALVKSPFLGEPYFYRTKRQRYTAASDYTQASIFVLMCKQLGTGVVSWFAPGMFGRTVVTTTDFAINTTRYIVLLGKAKQAYSILEHINPVLAKNPTLLKILNGFSLTSKMFFADFMMTSVVAEQPASESLAYWLDEALGQSSAYVMGKSTEMTNAFDWTDYTQEELDNASKGLRILPKFEHSPDLNKAWSSLVLFQGLDELENSFGPDSYIREWLYNGAQSYLVPSAVVTSVLAQALALVVEAASLVGPLFVKMWGTTRGKAPVNGAQVAPPASAASAPNASADQSSMSGDNSSTTSSDASQAKVPPVNTSNSPVVDNNKIPPSNTNKKLTPSDSGYLDESINENFKKRIAQLMKS